MPFNGSGSYSLPNNSWNPAVGGTNISSSDWNSTGSDLETALSTTLTKDGQTNPTANLPMAGFKHTGVNTNSGSTSRSEYVSGAVFQDGASQDAGLTGGTSTAYTATLAPAIAAYADKQCFRVQFNAACGATPTINFNSLGAKKIYKNVGGVATQLAATDVPTNYVGFLRYDTALDTAAGGFWLLNGTFATQVANKLFAGPASGADAVPTFRSAVDADIANLVPRSYLAGLGLSNNSGTPNTKIDVAAGVCKDSTNVQSIALGAVTIDCTTTGALGLDAGSLANNTWYHVFAIAKTDGTVSALASTSVSSPTLPSGYTLFRRLGSFKTNGSAQIITFVQDGSYFRWLAGTLDIDTSASATAVTATMNVPTGVNVQAFGNVVLKRNTSDQGILISDLASTDQAPSVSANSLLSVYCDSTLAAVFVAGTWQCRTNTSGQIRYRNLSTDASAIVRIATQGWYDSRGQNS